MTLQSSSSFFLLASPTVISEMNLAEVYCQTDFYFLKMYCYSPLKLLLALDKDTTDTVPVMEMFSALFCFLLWKHQNRWSAGRAAVGSTSTLRVQQVHSQLFMESAVSTAEKNNRRKPGDTRRFRCVPPVRLRRRGWLKKNKQGLWGGCL